MTLLMHVTFEDDAVGFDRDFREWGTPQSGAIDPGGAAEEDVAWNSADFARTGTKSGFAKLAVDDPQWKGSQGRRTEFSPSSTIMKEKGGIIGDKVTRWYAISLYLEANWADPFNHGDSDNRVFFQLPSGYLSPLWSWGCNLARTQFQLAEKRLDGGIQTYHIRHEVPIEVGIDKWVDLLMRIKWANDSDGEIEWWVNGVSVWDRQNMSTTPNPSSYNNGYLKFGIYHKNGTVHVDEFRMGDDDSSIEEMTPGGITIPVKSAAVGGTLVPAGTEANLKGVGGDTLTFELTNDLWIPA